MCLCWKIYDFYNAGWPISIRTFIALNLSQYYYWDKFKAIKTEKIFFISSGIISSGKQSSRFPTCSTAHKKFFETGSTEDYMNVAQIAELAKDPLTSIGGHSHSHTNIKGMTLTNQVSYIREDTSLMLKWFKDTLGAYPTKFCFPYNFNNWVYSGLLKSEFNIKELYGNEREDIMLYENICN